MKGKACMAVLALLLVATVLPAAEDGEKAPTLEQMALHKNALALQAHESELRHEEQLRELELEERRVEIQHRRRRLGGGKGGHGGGILLLLLAVNILVTVWVCKDMREQKIGRALWVPIVLLTGILGAILYALVRLADAHRQAQPPAGE